MPKNPRRWPQEHTERQRQLLAYAAWDWKVWTLTTKEPTLRQRYRVVKDPASGAILYTAVMSR